MKTLTKIEILAGARMLIRDGFEWVTVNRAELAMQSFSEQENARLTAVNKKQAELINGIKEAANHQIPVYAYGDNEAGNELAHRLSLISGDIETFESELAALEKEHNTCDGCQMIGDNGCNLDVSICPDCFKHDMWTPKEQPEPTAMEVIKEVFEPIQLTEEEAQKCYPNLCFCKQSTYTKGVCDKCGKQED